MARLKFMVLGALVLALVFPLVGGAQQSGGVLTAALTTNPVTLDPYISSHTVVRQVVSYIFETLVTYDENYTIIPQIAENWDVSADGLTYTFHLRSGIQFHNGKLLTSADVAASFGRLLEVSHSKAALADVKSFSAPDPLTFVIQLNKPILLLVQLAMPTPLFGILPEEVVKDHLVELRGPEELIGTGPYKLVEWKPGAHIKLARFDGYVPDESRPGSGLGGKKVAYFDEIHFIPVTEQASRLAGLLTGAYDYAENLPVISYDTLNSNPDITPMVIKPKWAVLVELNQAEPPMDNLSFRRALALAVNADEIMLGVALGDEVFYRVQPSIFYPEQKDWYTTAGSEYYNQHDMKRVGELLDEAGYHNEEIIILANKDYDWMYKCTLGLASQLQRAGINAVIEFMDWPSQIEKALSQKGWHINQTGWSPRFDPSQLVGSLACDSAGSYGYCNEEMEELLDELLVYHPLAERQEIWKKTQELVWTDVAVLRIGDSFTLEGSGSDIKGYKPWYVIPRFWNVWREE